MNKIDLGLAVLCSREWRETNGPVRDYTVMAEACQCSPQCMRQFCERTLGKVRVRLAERGVSRVEVLILLEVLGQGDSYSVRTTHKTSNDRNGKEYRM